MNKNGNYRRWLSYALRYWQYLVLAIVCILCVIAVDVSLPKFFSWIIDVGLSSPNRAQSGMNLGALGVVPYFKAFLCIFAFIVSLVLIRAILQYARTWLLTLVGERIHLDIRNALFDHLHHLPIAYFDRSYTGRIMARITTDTDALWGLLVNGVNGIIAPVLTFFIVMAMIARTDSVLSLVILAVVPVFFVVYSRARTKVIRSSRLQRETLSTIYSRLQEQIAGVRIVRVFGRSADERRLFSIILKRLYNRNMVMMKCYGGLAAKGDFIVGLGTALILCGGGFAVSRGQITLGELVQFYAYAGMLFVPIQTIANTTAQTLSNAEVAMERIFELLDQKSAVEFLGGKPCDTIAGDIEVRDLTFSYAPGKYALSHVDVTIKAGTTVAFVGPSGAGKSTLVNLICRFYDADSGEILIDGRPLRDIEVESFRSQISYVSQDNFLFSGSIADNIGYAKSGSTREEIEQAAKLANAHDFIMALPGGYETQLGERGVNLSGGQRQRITIARALIRRPRILILDEPSSALDAESESVIFQAINSVFRNMTCIVIAHRLSTVMSADSICVFEGSRLVAQGRHEELIASEGIYRELCRKQFIGPSGQKEDHFEKDARV